MKKNIKIALIDSGIDSRFQEQVVSGVCILYDENKNSVYLSDDYTDENGHGTYCAQIITSHCKHIEFIIIKILDQNNIGYSRALVEGLKYIIPFSVDIVNMSLAVLCDEYKKEIEVLCSRIRDNGAIINVSVLNHASTSFPASLDSTLGIRGAFNVDPYKIWYNAKNEIQCVSNLTPVLVSNIDCKKTFFGGNSKATALVSGLLAKAMYTMQIDGENALKSLVIKTDWCEDDIQKEFTAPNKENVGVELLAFSEQVCDFLKFNKKQRENILERTLFPPSIYIEKEQFICLIEYLSAFYHKEVILGQFEISNLSTILSIYRYFKGEK
ncbi:S8 family serine peptidase [Lachnospiraceae bacterium 38-14]|jgi:Subtilisin-like serine proteases|uniref:S8 family serine peptidase n=1 Tax=Bacteroides congonensis TaxID=1871006 RepID=UPI00321BFD9A